MALDPSLKDAVNYLQSHAHQAQAVIALSAAVSDIAVLESLAGEAEGRKAAADAALASVLAAVDDAQAKLDDANGAIEDARQTAAEALAKGKADAAALLNDANATAYGKAAGIVAAAEKRATGIDGKAADAQKVLDAINAQIDTAAALLETTQAETDAVLRKAGDARAFLKTLGASA